MNRPPFRILSELSYDPDNGLFVWVKARKGVRVGSAAGSENKSGYVQIGFEGALYYAHRLAFFFMDGEMPREHVDHVNGVRSDNRWENLRRCSRLQNAQNLAKRGNRKHDLPTGVSPNGSGFLAQIKSSGKNYYLGTYKTPDEASGAYLIAKAKLHTFNPNIRGEN